MSNRVDCISELKNPGQFLFMSNPYEINGLLFICPCGCGSMGGVRFKGPSPKWDWDGNIENPTITPSIQFMTGCKWHGFLTNGEFKSV